MSTPETKLTVETCNGAFSPAPSITFHSENREVLRITHDGHMITGEGLSTEEATQQAAKLLIASFEKEIQKMVDARIAVELARLRAENKLLCAAQKISEDSDGAIVMEVISLRARAEKAEADTARLDWLEANPEAIRAYSIHKSTFGRKVWWETGFGNYHTAREAIDAGMKEASK